MKQYLMILDFDETIAKTFSPSPHKIGVDEAYRFAIEELFGMSGLEVYEKIGGLQNRAPFELVKALLDTIETHQKPEKITEMIVKKKMSFIMKEIGVRFPDDRVWPEPCPGILDFFKSISEINKKKVICIDLAILSSGHTRFIKKAFKVWNLKCPEILITDDDAKLLPDHPIKPAKVLFDIILKEWKNTSYCGNGNAMYFGDDLNKDRKFAENAGIFFAWFSSVPNPNFKEVFQFSSWETISRIINQNQEFLREGKPFSQIFQKT